MTTHTLRELQQSLGIEVEPSLSLDELIPVLTGLQFQGDVAIIPSNGGTAHTPIPHEGVDAVRGEVGGHAHTVIGDGFFDPADGQPNDDGLVNLGILTVPEGKVAYLAHVEHGYSGIGPGSYQLRRQREAGQAGATPVWD